VTLPPSVAIRLRLIEGRQSILSLHLSKWSAVNIPLSCHFLYVRSHLKPRADSYCNLIVSPSYCRRILSSVQWEMSGRDDPTIAWRYFLDVYLCGLRKGDIWGLAWSRAKNQGLFGWFYFICIIIAPRQPLLVNYDTCELCLIYTFLSQLGQLPLGETSRIVSWSRSYDNVSILFSTAPLRDGFVVLLESLVSRIFQCIGTKGPAFTSLSRNYVFNWPDWTFNRVPQFWTTWKCAGGSRCEGRWWFMGLISVASE